MSREMALVSTVVALALLQFFWFGLQVGRARMRYKVLAPATGGHPDFERVFRVQMNTLEQLAMFLPGMYLFATWVSPTWATGLGAVYLVGRFVYAAGYARAADKRGMGFAMSAMPVMVLMVGGLIGALRGAFA